MATGKLQEDVTLLDVLIDGFEKNEVTGGFHWRSLPMLDESAAVRKFSSLSAEARAWKGPSSRERHEPTRELVAWPDLEIRRAGRALMIRVRAPSFDAWWHERRTWEGDPMAAIFDWLAEERAGA